MIPTYFKIKILAKPIYFAHLGHKGLIQSISEIQDQVLVELKLFYAQENLSYFRKNLLGKK